MLRNRITVLLTALLLPALLLPAQNGNGRPGDGNEYQLKKVVVFSRHNIRSPLSGNGSALSRITPHAWYSWTSAPGELSLRGGMLETAMGQYFRKWLVSEGLIPENWQPAPGEVRFYSNSMQRTIATARYFRTGMIPISTPEVDWHCALNTMDPVFTPQITTSDETFRLLGLREIAAMGGEKGMAGLDASLVDNYRLLYRVLDMDRSPAALRGDTTDFVPGTSSVKLPTGDEPRMSGALKLANQAADALILQYYEEPDAVKAAFGHEITPEEWKQLSAIKDWYGDVLFTAPSVSRHLARPLLMTLREELQQKGRIFTFLCGHDSNVGSMLAALDVENYELPETIETKTPIGCKLVFEQWYDAQGEAFVRLNMVYQSTRQLRNMEMLTLENPPQIFPLTFNGIERNKDGLYRLSDILDRFGEAIDAGVVIQPMKQKNNGFFRRKKAA